MKATQLKRLRKKLGWDTEIMADELGLSHQNYYTAIENGRKQISRRIEIIAEWLEASLDARTVRYD